MQGLCGGYYLGDTKRIKQAMHAELCKRVLPRKANYKIYNTSVADLVKSASSSRKPLDSNPAQPFQINVRIFDIAHGIALAKISTNKMAFIDYAQLARINHEWKIVNVLWAFTDEP